MRRSLAVLIFGLLLGSCGGSGPLGNSADGYSIDPSEIRNEISAEQPIRRSSTSTTDPGDSGACQRRQEDYEHWIAEAFAPLTAQQQSWRDDQDEWLAESGITPTTLGPNDPTDEIAYDLAEMTLRLSKEHDCNWSTTVTLP